MKNEPGKWATGHLLPNSQQQLSINGSAGPISIQLRPYLAVAATVYFLIAAENTSPSFLDFSTSIPEDHIMPRTDRDSNYKPLTDIIVFKALNAVTGHSRPLPTRNRRQSYDSYSIARNANFHRRDSVAYVPVHEPPSRRRECCLTPAPHGKAILQPSQFSEQTQSPLFKLPAELLLLIYEEVLGHNLFHIVRRMNNFQLGHIGCKSKVPRSQENCVENKCRGLKLPTGIHAKTGSGDGGLIQLLQSCRKMYGHLLYFHSIRF